MADLTATVDDVVRRERGRIVGGLLRLCGNLDAAEEAFQDAALAAVQAWREQVPKNPGADDRGEEQRKGRAAPPRRGGSERATARRGRNGRPRDHRHGERRLPGRLCERDVKPT
jgi:hypothetical protein